MSEPPPKRPRTQDDEPFHAKSNRLFQEFCKSSGLSISKFANSQEFKNYICHLNGAAELPIGPPVSVENPADQLLTPGKQKKQPDARAEKEKENADFDREKVGPTSLTVDIVKKDGENHLFFSTHNYTAIFERFFDIHLITIGTDEKERFISIFHQFLKKQKLEEANIQNIVVASDALFNYLKKQNQAKLILCFHKILSAFVNRLLVYTPFAKIFESLQAMMLKIKGNANLYDAFKKAQSSQGKETDLPVLRQKASWMETWFFLTKSLNMRENLLPICKKIKLATLLEDNNLEILSFYQRLLKICVQISAETSKINNSISQILPAFARIKNFLDESTIPTELPQILKVFDNANKSLERNQPVVSYRIASALDARYAFESVTSPSDWATVQEDILGVFSSAKDNVLKRLTRDINVSSPEEMQNALRAECAAYFTMMSVEDNRLSSEKDSIQWWKDKTSEFPCLSALAHEYLLCPATSINTSRCWKDGKPNKCCYFGKGGVRTEIAQLAGIADGTGPRNPIVL